ncbi:MAG: hypothetical protein HFF11_08325 [Angelakisella sp.]|jgi:hypothetical protein|nr:hypothetical protein [Angelakisella sp.]
MWYNNPKREALPVDGWPPNAGKEVTASVRVWGGYFFLLEKIPIRVMITIPTVFDKKKCRIAVPFSRLAFSEKHDIMVMKKEGTAGRRSAPLWVKRNNRLGLGPWGGYFFLLEKIPIRVIITIV